MSQNTEIQKLIRYYKEQTGIREVDMKEVARWAVAHDYPLPKPQDPYDILAKTFANAAREETLVDLETGHPYRVNHVYIVKRGEDQFHLWVDIDEAPRGPMHASLTMRRDQIVGDNTQLTFDTEHWNRINPDEKPIEMQLDYTLDVELRRHSQDPQEA
jgi:hypothetical protein